MTDTGRATRLSLSSRGITRRRAVGALLAAGASLALGAGSRGGIDRLALAQSEIEATPPARPSPTGTYVSVGPTIASKAAELGYDLVRIVRFVTEEIRYEPYVGALRGASATMWGLAGNSVDQALLLSALLTEAQITWRFAAGSLDEATANALIELATAGIAHVGDNWIKAVDASLIATSDSGIATPSTEDSRQAAVSDDALIADVVARVTFAVTDGEERFTSLAGQIAKALDDAHITIAPVVATVLPELELSRHVWVQVADGPRWSDIVPAFSSGIAKDLPEPAETFATIPDELIHLVSIRLSVETLVGSYLIPSEVAATQMTAVEASRAPIEIGVAPPQAIAAAGIAINEAIAGSSALVPYLASSGAILQAASSPIPFTVGGGAIDALGEATPGCCQDGELVSLSFTVDLTSPGAEPVTIQRFLLDRLSPAARAAVASGVDPAAIAPLNLVTLRDGTTMPAELTAATFLTVVTGDIPLTYSLFAPSADPAMKGIGLIGAAQAGLAASGTRKRLLPVSTHAFVATPQLVAFGIGSVNGDEESDLLLRGDLLHQRRALLTGEDGTSVVGLHPLIVAGIANQVAEDTAVDPRFLYGDAQAPIVAERSVGNVFAAAEAQGIGIFAITNATGNTPSRLPEAVSVLVQQALDRGQVVVIPEHPADMAGEAAIGWWEIDPATGDTHDVYANGKGYAETHSPGDSLRWDDAVEEADILVTVNTWRPWYLRLGRCVGAAAMIGGISVLAEGTTNVALGGNPATAAIKVAVANGNIVKDVTNLLKGC